eukprot:TRINITY_DN18420_c0_g1_i1.p1 TRINITY_DN18420_c0_g1~~TRINITY_DN18420_c0_g1_i1.p1  ORF type:complete len:427 (+),score=103.57 TRINITY_DN18420_c0_g1_i1:104-1282(+)
MNAPGKSPNMDTEYYSGWLTHYGESIANTSTQVYAQYLDTILAMNGSVSIYMGHGGTNFGFGNGANTGGSASDYQPTITSYDYNAPINENGDHGIGSDGLDKYLATKTIIQKYVSTPLPPEPAPIPRRSFGSVSLSQVYSLWDNLDQLCPHPVKNQPSPLTMEKLGQNYGFVLYRTQIDLDIGTYTIQIDNVRDRVHIFADQNFVGIIYRKNPTEKVSLEVTQKGMVLDILLENMGRVNYGPYLTDPKGIGQVTINSNPLSNWTMYTLPLEAPFPLTNAQKLRNHNFDISNTKFTEQAEIKSPAFYVGELTLTGSPIYDTYINTRGWTKGSVWINDFNLGRYWETQGPQHALYVPRSVLYSNNPAKIVVFELEQPHQPQFEIMFTGERDFQP